MLGKINYYITWDKLKEISASKIINSMYIWIFFVPIVLKVFELVNENIYNFVIFNETIKLQLELPFSLTIFYFSAVFFALGNLMIKAKCPLIIYENNDYNNFYTSGKKLLQLNPYSDDINYDWNSLAKQVSTTVDAENRKDPDREKEDPKNYFWYIYDAAKKERYKSRLLTGFFYSLGFLLMFVVLIQNFYSIINTLF